MEWADVAGRLAPARSYWLATASSSAVPHATPVWGVVVDEDFYFYSERSTVKARDLADNPRVVMHLESAEDVLIVHGTVDDLGLPSDHSAVVEALLRKYADPDDAQYLPSADPSFDVLYVLRPRRALAWRLEDWDGSQRRWSSK
jgi:nitroimidazol reductase NimA-like FMN-containing flavoprotein (pyridoxamine 5'-phosphate oxidase superfamily)